ncbi:hypothetical protein [Algibacillus agarilyticus]|uniref:hypothetical protein n=1 Tax=Algibacillus agarilyticus TaxID=2234133 RepID=UPI000DD00331|nr:hypothetical protein [Algibacillus agarilyticus]
MANQLGLLEMIDVDDLLKQIEQENFENLNVLLAVYERGDYKFIPHLQQSILDNPTFWQYLRKAIDSVEQEVPIYRVFTQHK